MQCPRCGEWSVYLQYGRHTCLACGWTRPAEWTVDEIKDAFAECFDDDGRLIESHPQEDES